MIYYCKTSNITKATRTATYLEGFEYQQYRFEQYQHIIHRLILECCSNDAEIELDFSNLELWADDCIPKALEATEDIEKIIVLVEGTSDKDILEFAMLHLYHQNQ